MDTKVCSKCKKVKDLSDFYHMSTTKSGYRPDCKECCQNSKKEFRELNPVRDKCNRMGAGIIKRTVWEIDFPKNKTYKDKGIVSEIGSTSKEVSDFLYKTYFDEIGLYLSEGIEPSVDRIDPYGNYVESNIRIISLKDNIRLGLKNAVLKTSKSVRAVYPNGKENIFSSVSEASRELSKKRDTIISSRDRGVSTKDGYSFYYLKGELTKEEKLVGEVEYRTTIMQNNIKNDAQRRALPLGIGNTLKERKQFLKTYYLSDIEKLIKKGITPGVGLIDSTLGYVPNNISIVNQEVLTDIMLRSREPVSSNGIRVTYTDGSIKDFKDYKSAAQYTGLHISTINRCMKLNTASKDGLLFVSI